MDEDTIAKCFDEAFEFAAQMVEVHLTADLDIHVVELLRHIAAAIRGMK